MLQDNWGHGDTSAVTVNERLDQNSSHFDFRASGGEDTLPLFSCDKETFQVLSLIYTDKNMGQPIREKGVS